VKTVAVANTWEEAAAILAEVGPLVSLQVAAYGLSVTYERVHQLCDEGKLPCYAICGVYHVPFKAVQARKGGFRIAKGRNLETSGHTSFAA
jgi:hypothetical protein